MNLSLIVPVISKILGKDVSPEIDLFYRARAAIGQSLNAEGQAFFIQNWPTIVDFMESSEGQVALATFLYDWSETLKPKSIINETVNVQES